MPRKADGEIWIKTNIDNSKAQKDLDKLTESIEEQEKSLAKIEKKREESEKQGVFSAVELDKEKAKLQELKKNLDEIKQAAKDASLSSGARAEAKAAIPAATVEFQEQAERVRLLQSEYNKIENTVKKYNERIEAANEKLEEQKEKAGELVQELAEAQKNSAAMSPAIEEANRRMEKFSKRIKEVVKSALIFSVITKALSAFKEWASDIVMANEESRKSLAQLKAALLTLAQPLVQYVIPAFNAFINVLTRAATAMAKITAKLFGTTIQQSAAAAEKLNQEAEAIKGVKNEAKKAQKTLAAFDEINQLSGGSVSGGSESVIGELAGAGEEITPDFSFYNTIQEKMSELEVYVSGALLAVGAILTFSGASVALGLGLMAIGALTLGSAIVENWDAMPNNVKSAINNTLAVLGGAAMVVGAILAFSGANMALGIGLMIAGAGAFGVAAALNWDAVINALRGPIGAVTAFAGTVLLGLGVLIAFSGNIALGVGMIAAGAATLGLVAALNWDAVLKALRGPLGAVVAAASGALLALGLVLAFSGAGLALGIALIAAGAVGLAATASLNWDAIIQALKGPVGQVVALASGALLAIGLILALSGFALPLGIALIAAGAAGLVTVTALNWDTILDKLKGAWGNIKNWWNTSVKQYFTKAYWQEKFSVIGESLTTKIKDGINAAIGLLNRFINWVNDKLHINWDALTIAGKEIIPAGDIQLLKIPNIPALAQGAVIPPNREFLAVLGDQRSGTNIEAPLSTIEQAVRNVLAERGGGSSEVALRVTAARGLARYLKFEIDAEDMRQGGGLVEYDTVYA